MTHREILGKRLRELRDEHGLSQDAVGDMVGMERSAISCYESGKRGMHTDIFKNYCEAFGLDANEMLGIERKKDKALIMEEIRTMQAEIKETVEKAVNDAVNGAVNAIFERYLNR